MEVSRQGHAVLFMDTSPSELIHTLGDKILVQSLINYFDIDFDKVQILQYNDMRMARKLAAQKRIIEGFEAGHIRGCGIITWNAQRLAMRNAMKFVVNAGYVSPQELILEDRIQVAGEEISIGHFLSLAWYSIALATNFNHVAVLTKFERKSKAMILLDLLPGDSTTSSRNLNVVRHIVRNTDLNGLFGDVVQHHKVSIGFGYGSRDGSTKELKREPPFCVSDWITHSFYAKLRREKIVRDEKYEELEPFTALADYLIEKGFFKVAQPIRFTDENLMEVPFL
jgi:hypothetical protein